MVDQEGVGVEDQALFLYFLQSPALVVLLALVSALLLAYLVDQEVVGVGDRVWILCVLLHCYHYLLT